MGVIVGLILVIAVILLVTRRHRRHRPKWRSREVKHDPHPGTLTTRYVKSGLVGRRGGLRTRGGLHTKDHKGCPACKGQLKKIFHEHGFKD